MVDYGSDYDFAEVQSEALDKVESALWEFGADKAAGLDRTDRATQKAASDVIHRIALGMGEDEILAVLHSSNAAALRQSDDASDLDELGEATVRGSLIVIGGQRVVTVGFTESEASNVQAAERDLAFAGPSVKRRGDVRAVDVTSLERKDVRGIKYSSPEFSVMFDDNTAFYFNRETMDRPQARMKALATFLGELDGDESA
ncbi:hypothetical protein [Micrococcus luteus]|uniref:hypothetical protein n=1 Tax=Micrococcus luteus TaxID=1270 RepID=UPI0015D8568F|nr:hypothetical protein [Micrococcus luteus]